MSPFGEHLFECQDLLLASKRFGEEDGALLVLLLLLNPQVFDGVDETPGGLDIDQRCQGVREREG
eukprot:875039-Pyramimonas_sp.AAC.1